MCSVALLCLSSASSQSGGEASNCLEKEAIGVEVDGRQASGCTQKTMYQRDKGSKICGDEGLPSRAKETTGSGTQQQDFR